MSELTARIVDKSSLPPLFPTHLHSPSFWEALGRTVATFGFMEDVLGRAVFALDATRLYVSEEELRAAYGVWQSRLERSLYEPLGPLITMYEQALRGRQNIEPSALEVLVPALRSAAIVRNVICHSSWGEPDQSGQSVPRFMNRRLEFFEGRIDVDWLLRTQQHAMHLTCDVISSVTLLGLQFPGSDGPGQPIDLKFRRS